MLADVADFFGGIKGGRPRRIKMVSIAPHYDGLIASIELKDGNATSVVLPPGTDMAAAALELIDWARDQDECD